jgi:hypothetical protein
MTSSWRSLLALAAGAAVPPAASAQQVRELGVQGIVTTAEPTLVAGGIYGAVRPSRHTRVALTLTGGEAGGSLGGRAELVAHALASPGRRRGAQVYGGAGIAGVVGPADRGYIVLLAGVEGNPAGRSGWVFEVGVGGGLRLSAGWHWRRTRPGSSTGT